MNCGIIEFSIPNEEISSSTAYKYDGLSSYEKREAKISSITVTDYWTTVLESDDQTKDNMLKSAQPKLNILENNIQEIERNLNF